MGQLSFWVWGGKAFDEIMPEKVQSRQKEKR